MCSLDVVCNEEIEKKSFQNRRPHKLLKSVLHFLLTLPHKIYRLYDNLPHIVLLNIVLFHKNTYFMINELVESSKLMGK